MSGSKIFYLIFGIAEPDIFVDDVFFVLVLPASGFVPGNKLAMGERMLKIYRIQVVK
jgi:hypothetical protein